MKLVKMTNNTSKTLTVRLIPFSADNAPIEVPSGSSTVVGIYSRAYSKNYVAMVKNGFSMSIIDEDSTVKSSIEDPTSKEPVVSSSDVTDTMPANADNEESSAVETEVVEEQNPIEDPVQTETESTEENLTEESPSKRRRSRKANPVETGDENA